MGKGPFKLRSQGSSFKMMGSSPVKHPHSTWEEAASHSKDQPHPKSEMTDSTVVDDMGNVIEKEFKPTLSEQRELPRIQRHKVDRPKLNELRDMLVEKEIKETKEGEETELSYWDRLKEKIFPWGKEKNDPVVKESTEDIREELLRPPGYGLDR